MLSSLIAQAEKEESFESKSLSHLLNSRIVIFDSGCSTAMVSRGWLEKYPSTMSNITGNPTIRIATANGEG